MVQFHIAYEVILFPADLLKLFVFKTHYVNPKKINWRQVNYNPFGWFTCAIVISRWNKKNMQRKKLEKGIHNDMRKMNLIRKTNNHKLWNKRIKVKSPLIMSLRMLFYRLNDVNDSIFGINGCITPVIHCPPQRIWSIHTKVLYNLQV